MVLDGERRGVIEPGGLIVEGTAGNTGIGLALVGNSRGYRTLILMPNTQSQEKKDALRLCGAELREVPAVPYKDPNNYVHVAARTAKELESTEQHGVLYANQWDNHCEPRRPYGEHGARDLAADRRQRRRLHLRRRHGRHAGGRQRVPEAEESATSCTAAADPMGAAIYSWIKTGELKGQGSSISEGIGQGRVTGNLDGALIDDAFQIPDARCCRCSTTWFKRRVCCSAARAASTSQAPSALRAQLGPGKTIVTVLCDSGSRYQSKLFNPDFLRAKDLPLPPWLVQELIRSAPAFRDDSAYGELGCRPCFAYLFQTFVLPLLVAAVTLTAGCAERTARHPVQARRGASPSSRASQTRLSAAQSPTSRWEWSALATATAAPTRSRASIAAVSCTTPMARRAIEVPRTSRELFRAARKIAVGEADPGDLMFFQDQTKLSHVGIYLGDGLFVHAPANGQNVAVASLDSPYYQAHFVAVGRLLRALRPAGFGCALTANVASPPAMPPHARVASSHSGTVRAALALRRMPRSC